MRAHEKAQPALHFLNAEKKKNANPIHSSSHPNRSTPSPHLPHRHRHHRLVPALPPSRCDPGSEPCPGFRIYAYDLPPRFNRAWVAANARCARHLFTAEVAVHEALLLRQRRAGLRPEEADLFLVPVYVCCNLSTPMGLPSLAHARGLLADAHDPPARAAAAAAAPGAAQLPLAMALEKEKAPRRPAVILSFNHRPSLSCLAAVFFFSVVCARTCDAQRSTRVTTRGWPRRCETATVCRLSSRSDWPRNAPCSPTPATGGMVSFPSFISDNGTMTISTPVPKPSGGSSVRGQGAILSSFSPSDWFKLLTEVPKYKQITPSILSERLRMMAFIHQKLVYKSSRRTIPKKNRTQQCVLAHSSWSS